MIGTQGFSTWSSRWLLVGMLALGISSLQAGRGTLAFFTSTVSSQANVFTAGTITVTGSTQNSGLLSADTSFSWNTAYGGTNCSTKLTTSTLITDQRLAPGQYCTAAITLTNSGNLDMWGRLRLVHAAMTDGALANSGSALNDRLIFYMAEYDTVGNRNTACAPGTFVFTPSASTSTATITTGTGGTVLTSLGGPGGRVIGATGSSSAAGYMTLISSTGAAPTEANMDAATKYYNLFGSNQAAIPTAGTSNNGTDAEALFTAGQSKYYCAAIFFPSDSGLLDVNDTQDNAAQGGTNTYYLHFIGAQKSGR